MWIWKAATGQPSRGDFYIGLIVLAVLGTMIIWQLQTIEFNQRLAYDVQCSHGAPCYVKIITP
jgi:hypothetical protein